MKPLSIQLYSLREESEKDFKGVIERVAKIGFKGIEPAGFYDLGPKGVRKVAEDNGMVVSSSHGPWAQLDNLNEVIETAGILGVDLVSSGFGFDAFDGLDAIKHTADIVNEMVEKLSAAGLTLFLHNHEHEFFKIDGKIAYDYFAQWCPDVKFEIDTYWASNFGANNPAVEVAKLKSRTPLLHIKDGPLVKGEAHLAAGTGKMDIPSVIAAADENVLRWLVLELDRCDTDMFEAVEQSYKYLVGENLALGNK